MDLMHNCVIKITEGGDYALYRVLLDEIAVSKTVVVLLHSTRKSNEMRAKVGRPKLAAPKRPRKKPTPSLVGKLLWLDRSNLSRLDDNNQLQIVELKTAKNTMSAADEESFKVRKAVMAKFFDFDHFREQILVHGGISGLINDAVTQHGKSRSFVYTLFSLLCRYGFQESRRDTCGAPGVKRPCDPDGRKKAGKKTIAQRIALVEGTQLPPSQPGMSSEWRSRIIAADSQIPSPKPRMKERITTIIQHKFVARYEDHDGKIVPIDPTLGTYPNRSQVRRVLVGDVPRLQRLLENTTKGHYLRSLRGLTSRNWKGVSGPGHTWAIDSTIGDIYLRSSVNRAWIVGRPIVYVIVDVWSTAVVGFYVCLTGPSWDTAKVSLFCAAAPPELTADLWGYQPMLSLCPAPTMCSVLMCDRGEYLSKGASTTGMRLIDCLSYAPPYRPDLKGLAEVLHRIEKDSQYFFVPGAIDARRKEYELRKFNPNEAVFTVQEYTAYLYTIFTEYNLTAEREHRVDAHMQAAGVYPSPAGLWRWGHAMGIGVRRAFPISELIANLLPQEKGRVTRNGVVFSGKNYESDFANDQQWSAYARNFGGWDIPVQYFPGSVSRIWTPDMADAGLLELKITDYTTASPELTFDEALDAYMFSKLSNAEVQHSKVITALESQRRTQEIIKKAKQLTEEANQRHTGEKPTMTEARQVESSIQKSPSSAKEASPSSSESEEARNAYLAMIKEVIDAANREGGGNG